MAQRTTAARIAAALGVAAALCASASARAADGEDAGEKGRLVPATLDAARLDRAYAPRKLALLVGVGSFDDEAWGRLRYPEKDAEDLAAVLRDPRHGAFDDVQVLKDAPTRAELEAALARLAERVRDERDTVVVYLSSHGTLARDGRGELRRWLVARDTKLREIPATALSMDALKAVFEGLRSRRKVLVIAACHSGGGKSLLPDEVRREIAGTKSGFPVRPIEEVSRASVVLAASDWGETAREDEKLENDIYTHFLVEALRGGAADRNADGAVTVSEAHDYARRLTYEFTAGRQRPSAESTEVGADPIVLAGRVERRGRPELYSYAPRLDGFTVKVNGREVAELPGGFAVEPGKHRIQLTKGGGAAWLDAGVALRPGERLDLEALVRREEGPWELAPRVALMGFVDGRSRKDVLSTSFGAGATLTRRDWPAGRFSLRLDLLGTAGSGKAQAPGGEASYTYSAFTAGASLPWRFQPFARRPRVALLAGPRFSLVRIERRFGLELEGNQDFLSFTPGAILGAGWDRGRLTFGAELHLDWMLLKVDEQSRSAGFAQFLLGAGWRF
jgi:hypothetical protein